MPVLRSGKVNCFSCGKATIPGPSAQRHPNGRVSYFVCPHCEADNYRDELGDVVDYVPATPKRTTPSYAHPARPQAMHQASPAFCRTCLHNQHVVRALLDQFPLPPEDDPTYEEVAEVQLPAYIRKLEERHPQVCESCQPKVSQKIRKSNYAAKAATLAAMRARTDAVHQKKPPASQARLLSTVWYLRGGVWMLSHALFLAWHWSTATRLTGSSGEGTPTLLSCLAGSYRLGALDPSCSNITARLVQKYGLFSGLGFFWVYRQHQAEQNPGKKLNGVDAYLKLEIATLLLRLISWQLLTPGAVQWTGVAFQRAHLMMGAISIILLFYSVTCLKLENPPPFSLRESKFSESVNTVSSTAVEEPLTSLRLSDTPRPNPFDSPKPRPFDNPKPRPFDGPQPQLLQPTSGPRSHLPPTTPSAMTYRDRLRTESPDPTPARSTYDPDAMDWTPISSPIKQRLPVRQPQASFPTSNPSSFGPSPFAYAPTVHAARHPTTNLFAKPPKPPTPPPGPQPFQMPTRAPSRPALPPARFHPPARRDAVEEGITSLLSGHLTLDDPNHPDNAGYDSDASTVRDAAPPSSRRSPPPPPLPPTRPPESPSTLTLRLVLLTITCYFLQSPRLWTVPSLLALVWRATMEYPDLGLMTVLAAAVVAAGGGWCGVFAEKASEMEIDKVGVAVAGVVVVGEVFGLLWRFAQMAMAKRDGEMQPGGGNFSPTDEGIVVGTSSPGNGRGAEDMIGPSGNGVFSTHTVGSAPVTSPGGGRMYVERGGDRGATRQSPRKRPSTGSRKKSVGGMMSGLSL